MTETKTRYRYFVRSADGRAIYGFEKLAAAETAAKAYGDGANLIDTLAQAYFPMLQTVAGGEIVYAGFGGWDTGRFALERDLIEAVKKGHPAIVHAFLEKGASARATDAKGGTALHWAVARGKLESVRLLLTAGADPAVKDATGQTPLDLARKRGNTEIVALLEGRPGG
ncbi:MAG: ankyrin repeat domain-containing protein [Hyphomicrobiaceae bacterium]|nr:MAG: ankyrin repeat domain-containing protein [Hyphomicrobiaceae bacterium]